jgi:Holliday junction resolvase
VARSEGQKRSQQHEKSLAAKTGGRRTPGSGSQWFAKGDVRTDHLLIEAKYTGKRQITIKAEVLEKISEEAILDGRTPIVSIRLNGRGYMVLEEDDALAALAALNGDG